MYKLHSIGELESGINSLEKMMETITDFRPSPIAGRWYPGNPQRLAESVDAYMANAKLPPIEGRIVAVIAPHAGHVYSGPVAGYAFAALQGYNPQIVAVISPMHHPYPQAILTTSHQAYQTPLGVVPVDKAKLKILDSFLVETLGYPISRVAHDMEHSLEIELPFLQRALPAGFSLLPIMVREVNPRVVHGLGLALAKTLAGENAMMVASSDLSHFYPHNIANQLDHEMLIRMESFDPDSILIAEEEGKGFACGRSAMAAVLWAARELGADQVKVLNYATSGDISGDLSQVVGYASAVVLATQQQAK